MTDFQSRFGAKIGRMNSNGQVYNMHSGKRVSAMGRNESTAASQGRGGNRSPRTGSAPNSNPYVSGSTFNSQPVRDINSARPGQSPRYLQQQQMQQGPRPGQMQHQGGGSFPSLGGQPNQAWGARPSPQQRGQGLSKQRQPMQMQGRQQPYVPFSQHIVDYGGGGYRASGGAGVGPLGAAGNRAVQGQPQQVRARPAVGDLRNNMQQMSMMQQGRIGAGGHVQPPQPMMTGYQPMQGGGSQQWLAQPRSDGGHGQQFQNYNNMQSGGSTGGQQMWQQQQGFPPAAGSNMAQGQTNGAKRMSGSTSNHGAYARGQGNSALRGGIMNKNAARKPPRSPRGNARRGGNPRSARKGGARKMAFQRTGMDGATPEAAGSRRPESFHSGMSPRRAHREQEARNEALAAGSSENQLYFSKKARRTDFDPKSLAEYRRLHPKEYVELGKLPADLNSPALIKKRANAERVKEFSRNLRMINKQMANQAANRVRNPKRRPVSKREKAHMYASTIKKPVAQGTVGFMQPQMAPPDSARDSAYGGMQPDMEDLSPLDQMELEHERNRDDVAAIRAGYGF